MNKTIFDERTSEIKVFLESGSTDDAYNIALELIQLLFSEKDYKHIVDLYCLSLFVDKSRLFTFELAYSLVEIGSPSEGELVYEALLENNPNNPAILNNLSNIKDIDGDIDEAWELIQQAYAIEPDDEIISRNYQKLLKKIEEREKIEAEFQAAIKRIDNENEFVINKLTTFFENVRIDEDYNNGEMPIPNWKFKILLETDEQKAVALKDQWLQRNYIRKTGKRGDYNVHIYQINPYLKDALQKVNITKMPNNWIKGINELDSELLASLEYFQIKMRITKVRKKYREILNRDIDELYINYALKNRKAVITLAGSIVETALMYYCEKKSIHQISYSRNQKQSAKKLYDADLGDLLCFFEQNGILNDIFVHMGNISRISRNFIHPGKELRESEELNQAKMDLCFISTLEIIKNIC